MSDIISLALNDQDIIQFNDCVNIRGDWGCFGSDTAVSIPNSANQLDCYRAWFRRAHDIQNRHGIVSSQLGISNCLPHQARAAPHPQAEQVIGQTVHFHQFFWCGNSLPFNGDFAIRQ